MRRRLGAAQEHKRVYAPCDSVFLSRALRIIENASEMTQERTCHPGAFLRKFIRHCSPRAAEVS